MARKAKIEREKRLQRTVDRYAVLRNRMKAEHDYKGLSELPRDASPVRLHSRDEFDGRPHAYLRRFGMSRLNFRKLAHEGKIPGVRKASW